MGSGNEVDKIFNMIRSRVDYVRMGKQGVDALGPALGWLDELSKLDRAEVIAEHNYNLGISSGIERSAKRLMEKATEAFSRGDDKVAKTLRALAQDLEGLAQMAHPGTKEKR